MGQCIYVNAVNESMNDFSFGQNIRGTQPKLQRIMVVDLNEYNCNNIYRDNILVHFSVMAEVEKEILTAAADEPFLGTLDFILLAVLLAGGIWWLLKRNRKEEKPATRSYSIQ